MAIDLDLGRVFLDALLEVSRPRYLERGLEPPARAPFGRLLIDQCPPSLQGDVETTFLGRLAFRPELYRAPDGTPHAERAPGTRRPRVVVSFSTANQGELGAVLKSLSNLDIDLVATIAGLQTETLGLEAGRVELFSLPAGRGTA